jgi:hypothetical protein
MKKILKKSLTCALVCASILTTTIPSAFAGHRPGCASQTSYVKCGPYIITTYASHYLHTNVTCTKTGNVSEHTRACTACDGNLGNLGGRVCSWSHQYCPTEYGVCQY